VTRWDKCLNANGDHVEPGVYHLLHIRYVYESEERAGHKRFCHFFKTHLYVCICRYTYLCSMHVLRTYV